MKNQTFSQTHLSDQQVIQELNYRKDARKPFANVSAFDNFCLSSACFFGSQITQINNDIKYEEIMKWKTFFAFP